MNKQSKKLIHLKKQACAGSALYKLRFPDENAEEARTLFFASYSEGEFDRVTRAEFQNHIADCEYCRNAFNAFEGSLDFRMDDAIDTAICPSSELLDCYVFDRSVLSVSQSEHIEKHLRDCEMCTEELNWLKDMEPKSKLQQKFSPNWIQSIMAAAAALVLALSAFLFWQKSNARIAEEELSALAAIPDPSQINYASLLETSQPLKEDLQPLFDQALKEFRTHRFKAARYHLERIRSNSPKHAATLYLLAYSYYKLNQPQKAFELCSLSESIHPHSYERCMFLVKIALKTRNYDRARLEINTLYHEAPDAPEVSHLYHEIMRLTKS
ncbi:MAG TPA: CDC27 family protein [Acidobacteriota bacterium]|nr:CDC27 family protein [Acidobacteriota bacterium]